MRRTLKAFALPAEERRKCRTHCRGIVERGTHGFRIICGGHAGQRGEEFNIADLRLLREQILPREIIRGKQRKAEGEHGRAGHFGALPFAAEQENDCRNGSCPQEKDQNA